MLDLDALEHLEDAFRAEDRPVIVQPKPRPEARESAAPRCPHLAAMAET